VGDGTCGDELLVLPSSVCTAWGDADDSTAVGTCAGFDRDEPHASGGAAAAGWRRVPRDVSNLHGESCLRGIVQVASHSVGGPGGDGRTHALCVALLGHASDVFGDASGTAQRTVQPCDAHGVQLKQNISRFVAGARGQTAWSEVSQEEGVVAHRRLNLEIDPTDADSPLSSLPCLVSW
jgi:hypothetical protein